MYAKPSIRRKTGNNFVEGVVIDRLMELLRTDMTCREISAHLEISTNTVLRYARIREAILKAEGIAPKNTKKARNRQEKYGGTASD